MKRQGRSAHLVLAVLLTLCVLFTGCTSDAAGSSSDTLSAMVCTGQMDLQYADQFAVSYYENGFSLVEIADGESYLIVPEGQTPPANLPSDLTVIQQPVDHIYLAASSAMDLFDAIDALHTVRATSTARQDWSLPAVTEAMDAGELLYAGRYAAPDYELILSEDCDIAIESTMIYHSPDTREQLQAQGIPVLIERSSYEAHPLGRLEWIKLYGLLLGKTEEAEAFFAEKCQIFDRVADAPATDQTAAFFYISPNGYINVRKPGDYVSRMIQLAGGRYIFTAENLDVEENALSTMNIQFEAFYHIAKDADVLIYNGTIDGGITSVDQLTEKNPLMADCKAVQTGNVWGTDKDMFQQTTCAAEMVAELHQIFTGEDTSQLQFFTKLERVHIK